MVDVKRTNYREISFGVPVSLDDDLPENRPIMGGMAAWTGGITMEKYRCIVCGYIYDPKIGDTDHGVSPGTRFENLPDDWVCPECGAPKEQFEKI